MKRFLIQGRIFCSTITILILVVIFSLPNFVFASEIYSPEETITIGEFIYNDDYTPKTNVCTISIYSPSNVVLVDNVTINDNATGWHYYSYLTPTVEGKYATFISCGSLVGGDLLKLDKTFIVLRNQLLINSAKCIR